MNLSFWYLTFQEQHSLITSKNFWVVFFFFTLRMTICSGIVVQGKFLSYLFKFNKTTVFHLPKSLLCLLIYGTRFSQVHSYLGTIVVCEIFSLGIILASPWISIYVNSAHLNCLNSVSPHNKPYYRTVLNHLGPYDILLLIHFEVHSSHLFNKFMKINNFVLLTILLNSLAFHNIWRGPFWTNYIKGRTKFCPYTYAGYCAYYPVVSYCA